MVTALTCPWCGAPLARLSPGQALATCCYCGSTASIGGTRAAKAQAAANASAGAAASAADPARSARVIEAFQAARQRGASPYEALVSAAQERLGPMGETDAFARVVLALGSDFDAENNTAIVKDAMCMGRLVEVYLEAIEGVRVMGSCDVNMRFFTSTGEGPKHFRRTLSADVIADLAAREPTKKRKGFWPFG